MDYINTSHPSFVGGSKAVEMALQDRRSSKVSRLRLALHLNIWNYLYHESISKAAEVRSISCKAFV